jgi:uncharacterized membrane protein
MSETSPPPDATSAADAIRFRWLAISILVGVGVLLTLYILEDGPAGLGTLALAGSAVFFSKLAIFGGNIRDLPFNPWELGLIAWLIDLLVSIALLAGIASFETLPFVGPMMKEAHLRAGVTMKQYPGLRRMALGGITLLVFLPIPGSGAITGTLVGRLVGLSRTATLLSVGTGAGFAVVVYAAVTVFLGNQWRSLLSSKLIVIPSLLGFALFCWWAWVRVKRELQRS